MPMILCETHSTITLIDEEYAFELTVTIGDESKTINICEECLANFVHEAIATAPQSIRQDENGTIRISATLAELAGRD